VLTIASGVTIDGLLWDVTQKAQTLQDFAGFNADDFYLLRLTASDGWYRTYNYGELYNERYFYGGLFSAPSFAPGTAGSWSVNPGEVGAGDVVSPMLALESWQSRINPGEETLPRGLVTADSLRFCIGQLPEQLAGGSSTTSQFGRGVVRIDLIMDARSDDGMGVSVTGVMVAPETASLKVGETLPLTAIVVPAEADGSVYWSSGDAAVATVDARGVVTAKAAGTATITAASAASAYSADCAVTVTAEDAPGGNPGDGTETAATPSASPASTPGPTPTPSSAPGVTGTPSPAPAAFNDIEGHWASESILTLAAQGYIRGYADGGFRPQSPITRAEFITILIRVLERTAGVVPAPGHGFPDTENHWARAEISTAAALGIVGGYGDGSFRADAPITREQIAVILAAAYELPAGESAAYTDGAEISAWARDAVAAAAASGLMRGDDKGAFNPRAGATRAEVAVVVVRLLERGDL
jgi:hypothetical protein